MAYLGSSTGRAAGSTDHDTVRGARTGARGAGSARGARTDSGMREATAGAPRGTPRVTGRPYADERDWARLATLGGGIAVGVLLGAGVALLFAPASGEDTREFLLDRARDAGGRVRDRFDDLRGDLRFAARRGRRGIHRGLARGRWGLEDAYDRASRHRR
jgi:hypothetical protein